MSKRIDCWECSDGEVFNNEEDAVVHERNLCFKAWYVINTLSPGYMMSDIDEDQITEWLLNNRKEVLKLYGVEDLYDETPSSD